MAYGVVRYRFAILIFCKSLPLSSLASFFARTLSEHKSLAFEKEMLTKVSISSYVPSTMRFSLALILLALAVTSSTARLGGRSLFFDKPSAQATTTTVTSPPPTKAIPKAAASTSAATTASPVAMALPPQEECNMRCANGNIQICHQRNTYFVTICEEEEAWVDSRTHGDTCGECASDNSRF
jgi:hypothetical protein